MPGQKKKAFSAEDVAGWTSQDVSNWLVTVKLEVFREQFIADNVTGVTLQEMTSNDIKVMNCTDKKKKAMKKALVTLPGNSVSSKQKSSKSKRKAKSVSHADTPTPPIPRDTHPLPPPVPHGFSRPPLPGQKRPPLPPQPGNDLYEDPIVDTGGAQWGGSGMIPDDGYGEEPGGIYDRVDEMDLQSPPIPPYPQGNGRHHPAAPPPPSYPPNYDDDDDQDIYEQGEELDEGGDDSFEDSFSSGNKSEDDYISPYEEEEEEEVVVNNSERRERVESDAIRALKGKFFAHGLTKHTGINVMSNSPASKPKGVLASHEQHQGNDDDDEEGEIYDMVPEEYKEYLPEEEDDGDIYDIPPEEVVLAAQPPIILPPKPKPPLMAPPPESAPPMSSYEAEEDIYDEGLMEEEEEMYDIPSEVIEEQQQSSPKPPPLPPPIIDEDIYDTADVDDLPASPSPPLPARPPKSGNISATPPIFRANKPPASPVAFNKPAMKKPIITKAPAATPPPSSSPLSSPTLPLPPRPPKSEQTAKAPPPPPPSEDTPPPQLPPTSTAFNRPPMRAPISGLGTGAPPPRPPSEKKPGYNEAKKEIFRSQEETSIENKLLKLSTSMARNSPSNSHSPKQSPLLGPRKQLRHVETNQVKKDSAEISKSPTPSPPIMKHNFSKPPLGRDNLNKNASNSQPGSLGVPGKQKATGSSMNKLASATKSSRISNLMKQFENKSPVGENDESMDGSGGSPVSSSGPSPITSPSHKLLASSNRPISNVSPLSGRKMERRESVDDLTKRFGGKARSPSPDVPIGKPSLPPKSTGFSKESVPPSLPAKPPPPPEKESLNSQPQPFNNKPPWMKKPSGNTQETRDKLPPQPWMKKPLQEEKDEPPKVPPPVKSWAKKPPLKPQNDAPPQGMIPSKGLNEIIKPPWVKDPSPERIEEEPPPPPKSWKRGGGAKDESLTDGGGSPDSVSPRNTTKKSFSYKPYIAKDRSISGTNQSNSSEPAPPKLPGRNFSEGDRPAPSLPDKNPPPSYRAPPEPSLGLPSTRNIPRPLPETTPPSLPNRNPTSFRPPPDPGSFAPALPSRNPPTSRPSDPPLPPRPGQPASDPDTLLPERSWKSNTNKQLPPDIPATRPPEIPTKRAPEPLPSSREFSTPSRPPKNTPAGSPAGHSWYHGNMDRKKAETILKHYSKDGTYIIRDSTKIAGEYSLSLFYGGGIRHLRIRVRPDKKFVLGEEKSDEHAFSTVIELVEHHRHEPFHLKSGGETTLKYECPH